ncbi:MAG: hypothetical protein JWN66_1599 [Sphingomonas bacterium]|uniref:hypothetical protein n=1 Tax=Sphingomonas bacterium TaxID=1895847 RepID=UPI00262124BA|nr:hypothetical protein [Sphingomonas bacterium]MDB5704483.1 hypothetical protein [Sphingomonas bacterium]
MTIFGKTSAAMALAAMSLSAVPVQAQSHGPRHRGGHDRIDGGDVLLGAVLAGGLFALLSSGKKHESAPPPEEAVVENGGPAADVGPDGGNRTLSVARSDEEAAVDACVSSAESEGRRYARIAKIDKVTIVDAVASDWIVRGTLALRDDYRSAASDHRDFSCRVGERGVEQVTIDGDRVAAN